MVFKTHWRTATHRKDVSPSLESAEGNVGSSGARQVTGVAGTCLGRSGLSREIFSPRELVASTAEGLGRGLSWPGALRQSGKKRASRSTWTGTGPSSIRWSFIPSRHRLMIRLQHLQLSPQFQQDQRLKQLDDPATRNSQLVNLVKEKIDTG